MNITDIICQLALLVFFVYKMETQRRNLVSSFPKVLSHLSNTKSMTSCVFFFYTEHIDVKTDCLHAKMSNCCMIS